MILPAHPPILATSEADISVEWEETPCLLCGGPDSSPLVEAPDAIAGGSGLWFAVVQCQNCGLCFTNPRPSPGSIQRFYPPTYQPHRTPEFRGRLKRTISSLPKEPGRGKIAKVLARRGGGRLLDFGCGGGRFLKRMHCAGWDVTGLDASEDAVKRIRFGLGLRAHVGTLPCPNLPTAGFDLITMWQALEHVHDPLDVLRDAYRLLAPGGELMISLPNIDSLSFRIFGHAWLGLDLPRHLTHFTPPTLHAMLERAGFSTDPAHMIRRSGWLRASAKLANRLRPGATWQRWLRAKPPSSLLTWYSYLTAQSDCMMVKAFK